VEARADARATARRDDRAGRRTDRGPSRDPGRGGGLSWVHVILPGLLLIDLLGAWLVEYLLHRD